MFGLRSSGLRDEPNRKPLDTFGLRSSGRTTEPNVCPMHCVVDVLGNAALGPKTLAQDMFGLRSSGRSH
eukprot:10603211-Lingulodinium_polyedra.AAC.1